MADDRAVEDLEVAGGVLGGPEGGRTDVPGRVIDRPDQGEHGSSALEPVVAAAVDLEEHPRPRHPLAPAAVAGRTTRPGQGPPGLGHDPADRPGRDRQLGVALLRERLGQMDRVEARELGRRQFDQADADRLGRPVDRRPPAVAVDERRRSVLPVPIDKAPDLAAREPQDAGRLVDGQLSGEHVGEDIQALLGSAVQADRLPRLDGIESDKVAVPLARTESLSFDTAWFGG